MRLIIPVAGKGTRLYPHTLTIPKPLLSIAGKPIISHVIDRFKELPIDEIMFVISPGGESIVRYVEEAFNHFKISFVYQEEPLGLGHAVYQALKDDCKKTVMIALGDTIFEADFKKYIDQGVDFVVVKDVDDPQNFGVVEVSGDKIVDMEEKPQSPRSNLAIIGVYFITEAGMLKDALEQVISNDMKTRGEYQLTDALRLMLKNDWRPHPVVADMWLDCGRHDSLLEANRVILRKTLGKIGVELKETSVLIHPVFLGKSVLIRNSVVGPYVTVSDGAKIENSVVSNSIVSSGVQIINAVVKNSIISGRAKLEGKPMELQLGGFSIVRM